MAKTEDKKTSAKEVVVEKDIKAQIENVVITKDAPIEASAEEIEAEQIKPEQIKAEKAIEPIISGKQDESIEAPKVVATKYSVDDAKIDTYLRSGKKYNIISQRRKGGNFTDGSGEIYIPLSLIKK